MITKSPIAVNHYRNSRASCVIILYNNILVSALIDVNIIQCRPNHLRDVVLRILTGIDITGYM